MTGEEIRDFLVREKPVGLVAGVEQLTSEVLQILEGLRVISRCGSGLDSVDLQAAERLKIAVFNTPEAPVVSVAEHTIMLILALFRHVNVADAGVRSGNWRRPAGTLMQGKIVGILGCGRIGSHVAALAAAFGCTVLGHDPYIREHKICKLVDLDTILKQSDILSLHLPLSPKTRGLIDAGNLRKVKDTCVIINTARGELINETELFEALKEGQLAGAALDVFSEEPYSGPLVGLPEKTILSPHLASSAREARIQMEESAVSNLIKGLTAVGIL